MSFRMGDTYQQQLMEIPVLSGASPTFSIVPPQIFISLRNQPDHFLP